MEITPSARIRPTTTKQKQKYSLITLTFQPTENLGMDPTFQQSPEKWAL